MDKKKQNTILAVPSACFWAVVATCLAGIAVGSVADYPINVLLAHKTALGAFFATYGSYFSYCLYPAAGACLFVGLREKGARYRLLAWTLLFVGYFMAVYYSNNYNGKAVRALFAYQPGQTSAWRSVASWLFWAALYAWVAPVVVRLADRSDADKLIAVGAAILLAGICADNVNLWLKQVASRPRFKYLLTLSEPQAAFRAARRAPGLTRAFDVENWPYVDANALRDAREDARRRYDPSLIPVIRGSDISAEALTLARRHIRQAGLEGKIEVFQKDLRELQLQERDICFLTNPPYGERLGDIKQCEALYRQMKPLIARHPGSRLCVITSHPGFERVAGMKAQKKTRLYNGRLECNFMRF